jgi:hypothetical protein
MQENERVLVAVSGKAVAARAAQRIVATGGEVIVASSIREARAAAGKFDRGIFGFDLEDGSGIILAAELMMDARIDRIEFVHPKEELLECQGHPTGMRSTSGFPNSEQLSLNIA